MASKPSKVNPTSGVMALITVLCSLTLAYTGYLVETGRALDFQASMLGPSAIMIKPLFLMRLISEGGYLGTAVAVALQVAHSLFAVTVVFTVASLLFSKFGSAKQAVEKSLENPDVIRPQVFACEIVGSDMLVSIPPNKNARTGAVIEGVNDTNPYIQNFFRIDSKPIKLGRPAANAIEQLHVDILEMMSAHPDVPASLGSHHSDATLMSHSKDVAKKVKAVMARKGRNDPLTGLVGLAHDLDKLLAYKKQGDKWVKNQKATHHNTYSAYIVQHLPTFKTLDPGDQHVLIQVLRYYHHPEQLPLNAGERIEVLIQAIREADGWGTRDERAAGIETAKENPNTTNHLSDALASFLADADINKYKGGGIADGWTVDAVEYVIVPASTVLENLHKFLPQELTKQLQLNVDTRIYGHPAIEVIQDTMRRMGLLMDSYKDISSPTGLFDVKVGVKHFSACFLLDKNNLLKLLPTTVPKWGMSQFGIRIRCATSATPLDHEED